MNNLTEAFAHCPLCGSKRFERLAAGQRHCLDCDYRDFNNPIAAVAALIPDEDGRLLFLRRAREPAKGKLVMPGGFVDPDESLESAVRREVEEETGLRLARVRYLTSHPNSYVYSGLARPVCDAFFLAEAEDSPITLEQHEVSASYRLDPQQLDPAELAFDSMRHALRTFLEGDAGRR